MEVQANVENDSATCFIDDPASYYFKCSDLLISPSDAGDPFTGLINPNQDPAVIEQMRQAAGPMVCPVLPLDRKCFARRFWSKFLIQTLCC